VKPALIAIPVLLAATAGACTTFVKVRADLTQQRADILSEWHDVEQAMQERANVIGDLVSTAEKLGPVSEGVRTETADARKALRSGSAPGDKIQANLQLSNALAKVLVESESHPQWRDDPGFLRLQEEIRNSDDHIAEARLKYNDSLEHYNAHIQSFPQNLVARISGFGRNDAYFPTEHF